ncbi:MAG: TIGR02466 family protein [Alphaproteobacteria bacterium]
MNARSVAAPPERTGIESLDVCPTADAFFDRYVLRNWPVLLPGAAADWPALTRWTDEWLSDELGDLLVSVEHGKRERRTHPLSRMPLREFLDRYRDDDLYCVEDLPVALRADVQLPACLRDLGTLKGLHASDTNIWFNAGGAKSVLHLDEYENLFCVVAGRKRVLLANSRDQHALGIAGTAGYADLDLFDETCERPAQARDVDIIDVTLGPGDVLYIPQYWPHQVLSIERSIAVNFWWQLWPVASNTSFPARRDQYLEGLSARRKLAADARALTDLFLENGKQDSERRRLDADTRYELRDLYASTIFLSSFPQAAQTNPELAKLVEELQRTDTENAARSRESYDPLGDAFTTYYEDRTDDIFERPEVAALLPFIAESLVTYARALGFSLRGKSIKLNRLWFNVNTRGSRHGPHLHPDSVISGTYYIQVPAGGAGGELKFSDPTESRRMAEPTRAAPGGDKIMPWPGLLVMFPSWLAHEVLLQRAEGKRIGMSFNAVVSGRSGQER